MKPRKRGGQPGNTNAVTHGRYSAEYRAQRVAEWKERQRQSDEWCAAQPKVNYQKIIDALEKERKQHD